MTMHRYRVAAVALETAHQKLKAFRTRLNKTEWKAFQVVNANDEKMKKLISANKWESLFRMIMEKTVRLPCIVCQSHQGVIYCSITFTSKLSMKEKITDTKFKPPVYLVFYPNECVFYTTRGTLPDVVSDAIVELFGATRLNKLPLVGKSFPSLRQLHYNKVKKGQVRRIVQDSHPLDFDFNDNIPQVGLGNCTVVDEDQLWKRSKTKYYRKHFCPESDPILTKFTISSSTKFRGMRATRQLDCDLKVTFRTENLLSFFDYSMDKGILSYPLNPYLQDVIQMGTTSVAIESQH